MDLFCSHGGGQTVELCTCSVAALDAVNVVLSDFIFKGETYCAFVLLK